MFVNGALDSLDVPSVGVDERYAGQLATQHLIGLQARSGSGSSQGRPRLSADAREGGGQARRLRAAGLDGDRLVAHGHFSPDGAAARRSGTCSAAPASGRRASSAPAT